MKVAIRKYTVLSSNPIVLPNSSIATKKVLSEHKHLRFLTKAIKVINEYFLKRNVNVSNKHYLISSNSHILIWQTDNGV